MVAESCLQCILSRQLSFQNTAVILYYCAQYPAYCSTILDTLRRMYRIVRGVEQLPLDGIAVRCEGVSETATLARAESWAEGAVQRTAMSPKRNYSQRCNGRRVLLHPRCAEQRRGLASGGQGRDMMRAALTRRACRVPEGTPSCALFTDSRGDFMVERPRSGPCSPYGS